MTKPPRGPPPRGTSFEPSFRYWNEGWITTRQPRVAFVLGKPPERSPVVPEVIDGLRRGGVAVRVEVPGRDGRLSHALGGVDLLVLRGLGPAALAAARDLEGAGMRCCNNATATSELADRALTHRRLEEADAAVPRTRSARTWAEVMGAADGGAVVVKAQDGSRGRGAGVISSEQGTLPSQAPFEGPYLVQERIPGDGTDRKLYVIGPDVRGLLKRWPRRTPAAESGRSFLPSDAQADLAGRVGATLGLEIYGVDVVEGPLGLVVVDVNAFPSCRGVPHAADLIAAYLAGVASRRAASAP